MSKIVLISINKLFPPNNLYEEMEWDSPLWNKLGNPNRIDELIRDEGLGVEDFPPIEIRKSGEILDGCHRYLAFKLMGIKTVKVLIKD